MAAGSPIPLSNFTGGVNRFEHEAGENQAVEAENVWEENGQLVRRPSFDAILTAPGYSLPCGSIFVKHEYPLGTFTSYTDRNPSGLLAARIGGSVGRLWVGCRESFDGIELEALSHTITSIGADNKHIVPRVLYTHSATGVIVSNVATVTFTAAHSLNIGDIVWTTGFSNNVAASAPVRITALTTLTVSFPLTAGSMTGTGTVFCLQTLYGSVDTTRANPSGDSVFESGTSTLLQAGKVSWHTGDAPDWESVTLNSQAAFWIALDVSVDKPFGHQDAPAPGVLSSANTHTILAPGVKGFILYAVNGLYAGQVHKTRPVVVITADVEGKRARTRGGLLGTAPGDLRTTEDAFLTDRTGSCVIGSVAAPTWSTIGSGGASEGTASLVTKLDQTYRFSPYEQAPLSSYTAACTSAGFSSTTTVYGSIAGLNPSDTRDFENWFLEITATGGAGGLTAGDTREIVSISAGVGLLSSEVIILVYPAFGGTPNTSTTYTLRPRPNRVRFRESAPKRYLLSANGDHTLTFHPTTECYVSRTAYGLSDSTGYRQFETGPEPVWALDGGNHWHFITNSTTGRVLATNGLNGIYEYDGVNFKRLRATYDSTFGVENASAVVAWTGRLNDTADEAYDPSADPGNVLRRAPPDASLFTYYRGHIVCVLRNDPTSIQWSAPSAFNDLWPAVYSTKIIGNESTPITGLFTLNDELVACTANGIHAAQPPGADSIFVFAPLAQGFGFINAQSVATLALAGNTVLLGPNADGIYAFTGSSPQAVLDDWERILPGGVNLKRLHKACGAVWRQTNRYFCAVPSSGSTVNDKIVVVDFSQGVKFWVWSAPYGGVTSMCRDFDAEGKERILFGTADGHVCVLGSNVMDGGSAIEAYAKSPPIPLNNTMALTSLRLTASARGSTDQLTVETFVNNRGKLQTITTELDAGGALYNTGTYGTSTWSTKREKTVMLKLRAGGVSSGTTLRPGTVGETFQYKIKGSFPFRFKRAEVYGTVKGGRMK